jgi:hypothetical protein
MADNIISTVNNNQNNNQNTNQNNKQDTTQTVTERIQKIFEENKLTDLQNFFKKRHFLNNYNICLIRLTDLLNAVGVFTATIGVGYNDQRISLFGIGLNVLGLLLTKCTQTNQQLSDQMLRDIINIKNNNYIDESNLIVKKEPSSINNEEKV